MRLIELRVQLLIMLVDFSFLIVLDVPAHHDDRLPHEKHKCSAQDGKSENEQSIPEHQVEYFLLHYSAEPAPFEQPVRDDAFHYLVERAAHHYRRHHRKKIGKRDEQYAKQ